MVINIKMVVRVLGMLLFIIAGFMLLPILASLYFGSGDAVGFLLSALCSAAVGGGLLLSFKPKDNRITRREGYLIVALGWGLMCLSCTMPYLFNGSLANFGNALFESTSGLTTTGASVFNDIEALPQGIILWRSLTQWMGGMGIIVLTVALLPLLGIGGVELFVAEAPGPTSDKIHPRIKETAKRLWGIYVGLTTLLTLVLSLIGEMSVFDAINHALTTMSTGGFSTKNASMAHFSPMCQYPIMLFMFIGGMNYTIIYYALKGKFGRVWQSDEFKTYLSVVFTLIFAIGISIHLSTDAPIEKSFRDAAFQIISVITTTGFVSADYTAWNNGLTMVFFILLFVGACAGSTSGGIKIIRHLVFFKNSHLEFKRLLHPRAFNTNQSGWQYRIGQNNYPHSGIPAVLPHYLRNRRHCNDDIIGRYG